MRTTRDEAVNIIKQVCRKIPLLDCGGLSVVMVPEKMSYRVQSVEDGPVTFVSDSALYQYRDSNGKEGEIEIIDSLSKLALKTSRGTKGS